MGGSTIIALCKTYKVFIRFFLNKALIIKLHSIDIVLIGELLKETITKKSEKQDYYQLYGR